MLYGDFSDILEFNNITSDADHSIMLPANSVVDLRRDFESLYVYSSMVEPRVVDKIVANSTHNGATRRDGDDAFRARTVQY